MIAKPSNTLHFKAHAADGVLIPDENVTLTPGRTYWVTLQVTGDGVETDALAEIAKLAQPLGPDDLARNFDAYTGRVVAHESTQ